jgi:hypothetical protein
MGRDVGAWMRAALMVDGQGAAGSSARAQGFNPHPANVMQADGTSYLLLALLVAHPTAWFTQGELMRRLRRSRQSVSWALQYLKGRALVLETEDGRRNPRYRRYRLAVDPPAPLSASALARAAGHRSTEEVHALVQEQVPLDLRF